MKAKVLFGILVMLIIVLLLGISTTKNKNREYDEKISSLNNEISQLQKKELEYNNLIEQKNQLTTKIKNEIINSKKGSNLVELEDEKSKLINAINNL